MKKKKDSQSKQPKVNSALKGFDLSIDSFGEIKSSMDIDQLNQFLNEHVEDKKLKDREDLK